MRQSGDVTRLRVVQELGCSRRAGSSTISWQSLLSSSSSQVSGVCAWGAWVGDRWWVGGLSTYLCCCVCVCVCLDACVSFCRHEPRKDTRSHNQHTKIICKHRYTNEQCHAHPCIHSPHARQSEYSASSTNIQSQSYIHCACIVSAIFFQREDMSNRLRPHTRLLCRLPLKAPGCSGLH